ncbi:MAG: enoyl-CoA hydratase/isomerase family protein, partial [Acidobacteriaceae bacterium]|nr:enoyl-CoA hydratase/isomerase family protein [Acidobacteriaceae bacterium]
MSVLYRVDGGLAHITLNRPEKRNALNAEMIALLHDAMHDSATASGVRVVLLSGAGADFCSGADLAAVVNIMDAGALENMADANQLADLFLAMRRHPRPIVAAVKGRAFAGGCGLATAADVILASETAQFGYPEVNVGFVPAMVMAILRRSLTEKRAFDLIAMGEIISAQSAYESGLITRILADETFDLEVEAYVSKLMAKPASAVALSK